MASTSNRRGKEKTSQPWTTTEEITLCIAWCKAMENYGTRDMKKGFGEIKVNNKGDSGLKEDKLGEDVIELRNLNDKFSCVGKDKVDKNDEKSNECIASDNECLDEGGLENKQDEIRPEIMDKA
ncbi:hypothetical protein Tco_0485391 [Tanacetum coccineum]